MLQTFYETYFGIYDHLVERPAIKKRPLALVALHECEENSASSSINELIELYFDREVNKHFGLSLYEFLDLPREYNIRIQELILKKQQAESTIINNLQNSQKQLK